MSLLKLNKPKNISARQERLLKMIREDTRKVRLNVNLPPKMYADLKHLAADESTSISDIIIRLIETRLKKSQFNKPLTEEKNPSPDE